MQTASLSRPSRQRGMRTWKKKKKKAKKKNNNYSKHEAAQENREDSQSEELAAPELKLDSALDVLLKLSPSIANLSISSAISSYHLP